MFCNNTNVLCSLYSCKKYYMYMSKETTIIDCPKQILSVTFS